jgi:DNA mismatch endonuclease (patch repair protein)
MRFRVDHQALPGVRCRVDIAFTRAKVAVFVDGCFWHACPIHGTLPKSNRDWWSTKLALNTQRDRRNDEALRVAGWRVVRIWEHEQIRQAADLVESRVAMADLPCPPR